MLEFLCYFIPASISIKVYEHLNKKELSLKDNILYYLIFTALNNLFTLVAISIKNYKDVLSFDKIGITYCFKYLLMSVCFAIITPFIISIIRDNISLRVEVKKNEKTKKSH